MALGAPALAGFLIFYIFPFIRCLGYAFTSGGLKKHFSGFENFLTVAKNPYFKLAVKNTLLFSLIGTAAVMLISIVISFGLIGLSERLRRIKNLFIMPYVLPTAGVILIWRTVFDSDFYFPLTRLENLGGLFAVLPLYLLFIWKNIGINIILITAAISKVPKELFEAAAIDGAKMKIIRRKIVLPTISPALLFSGVLSFVNSLKIFRESYLFYGTEYPPDAAYMLQNYMNNHFYKLNYENLSAAVVMFTLLVGGVILAVYLIMEKSEVR